MWLTRHYLFSTFQFVFVAVLSVLVVANIISITFWIKIFLATSNILSVNEQFIFLGTHPFTLSVILRLQGLPLVGVKFNPIKVYLLPFGIAGETWSLFLNHFSFWVPTYMVWLSQFFNLVIYLKLSPCTFLSKFWKDIIRHKHPKTIPWTLQSKRTSL